MESYLNILLRATVTFGVLMILIRLQGKKQIVQFSYFNYVNGIVIGSLAASVVFNRDERLIQSIFIVIVWGAISWLISYLSIKSMFLRKVFEGIPRFLIKDGHLQEGNLRKEYLTIEDVNSMLRQSNNFAIADVEAAIIELNGTLSVQSKSENQMVTRKDLNLRDEKIGIALPLIIDGEIVEENLKPNNISIEWINTLLKSKGLPLEEVLYMELGIDGQIKIERKD